MKNEQEIIDKHFDQIFKELMNITGDDLFDLSITISDIEGRTYTRSWRDRDRRIQERDWQH